MNEVGPLTTSEIGLQADDVTLTLGGARRPYIPVLDSISFVIPRGELVCIVGPSGCGKSTLLNVIAGHSLSGRIEGELLIAGAPRVPFDTSIGYMTQHDTLLPWRTVYQNVALAARLRGAGEHGVRTLLGGVGLSDFSEFFPHQLSGGMRKRVQLARLFAQQPEVLLMDEPFGALDYQTRLQMHELFLATRASTQATTLFVTHDLQEALLLADRVLVLSDRPARVIGDFAVTLRRPRVLRDLVKEDEYQRLYERLWDLVL